MQLQNGARLGQKIYGPSSSPMVFFGGGGTVDGRNPAPVDMVNILLFTRVLAPSQVVGKWISEPSTGWNKVCKN